MHRLAATLLGVGVASMLIGCASRPSTVGSSDARPGIERDGWVRVGAGIRLREDAPPLLSVLPQPEIPRADGDFGPRGSSGDVSAWDESAPPTSCGAGYGTYLLPGGAVPPGLREPHDAPSSNPFSAPNSSASREADVGSHRPGLSTGSGIYGRD
jgi:hypothetical protein